jgi:curved DNA-binding protein CbpA
VAKNYYAMLGVSRNATDQQIRLRFKQIARQRHPDRFQDAEKAVAEREFQEITEAFNLLTNPQRRREHDLELARPEAQQGVDSHQLAKVYLQRGTKAYREKNYLEAADNFDRATKAEPENALAWYNLALTCGHQQRWLTRALTAIGRACELEPMNPSYLLLAGRTSARAGMFTRAEQAYQEAVSWGADEATVAAELEEMRRSAKARSRSALFGKAE